MPKIQIKRATTEAIVKATPLSYGEFAYAKDTNKLYIGTDGTAAGNMLLNPDGGVAEEAAKLSVARAFSISGDGTAPAINFDGTAAVNLVLSLASSGVTAGTYTKVAVDAKGRVTAGYALTVDDLPSIPASKVTGLGTAATKNTGTTSGTIPVLDTNGKLTTGMIPDISATYIPVTQKGANNGVAELDATGKVPSGQLPSYVDDVLEYATKAEFPNTGETGKIYIALDTNLTYRWSGTAYVEISPSLALGTTSSTAFRGDYGNTIYNATINGKKLNTSPSLTAQDVGADPAGTAATKVASVTAGDNSVTIGGTATAPTVAAKISPDAGNSLTLKANGLYTEGKTYTAGNGIEISSANAISAKVVASNGLSVGATGIQMAVATTSAFGSVKADGVSILNGAGTLSVGNIDCGEVT